MNMKVERYSVRKPNDVLINKLALKGKIGSLKDIFEVGKNVPTQIHSSTTEKIVSEGNTNLLKNKFEAGKPAFRKKFFPTIKEGGIAADSVPFSQKQVEKIKIIQEAVRARTKLLASKEFNDAGRQELTYKSANSKIYGKKFYRGIEGFTLSVPDRKPSNPLEGGAKKAIGMAESV